MSWLLWNELYEYEWTHYSLIPAPHDIALVIHNQILFHKNKQVLTQM